MNRMTKKVSMKISEVNIDLIKPKNGLIGFASLVLDQKIYLSSIGIHKKLYGSGYRLTYPSKKIGNKNFNLFHPIESSFGIEIEKLIIKEIKKVMNDVRHSGFNLE